MRNHRTIVPLLIVCAVIPLLAHCSGSMEADRSGSRACELSHVNAWHKRVESTHLSELQEDLFDIIEGRITCYQNNLMTDARVRECRKKYVRKVVGLCRERIQSSPMLGDSILCFENCPMMHAVCKGDHIDDQGVDCVADEARCIEYCLDYFWRGGGFPTASLFSK